VAREGIGRERNRPPLECERNEDDRELGEKGRKRAKIESDRMVAEKRERERERERE